MRLPPFSALRCTEAVTRLGSVTRAAAELEVTQSAVSRQIIEFEKALGATLFIRDRGRLKPTVAGQRLSNEIARAFEMIADAVDSVKVRSIDVSLTLSMVPSFATKWLAPRLDTFLSQFPAIALSIKAAQQPAEFVHEAVDAELRYGKGDWPGMEAVPLGSESIVPVCSPRYASSLGLVVPRDLSRAVLLHGESPVDWTHWARHVGVDYNQQQPGLHFMDDAALIEAAASGLGIALARSVLVMDDIHSGRLVAPFKQSIASPYRYWFVWPRDAKNNPAREAFLSWIRSKFAEMADA